MNAILTRKQSSALRAAATPTGCTRPESLFGLWCIEQSRFGEIVRTCKSVDLVALAKARADGTPGSPLPTLRPGPFKKKGSQSADPAMDDDGDDEDEPPYRNVDGLAVMSISGPMTKYQTSFSGMVGGTATTDLRRAFRQAADDPDVMGVVLCIDSPGGTVSGNCDLCADIRECNKTKPVTAFIQDMGCSAAYWAASQCDRVYANSSAMIGCIGTMLVLEDTSQAFKQDGVTVHVVTSDTATGQTMKGSGVDGAPVTDDQLANFKREVNEQNDLFVADVAAGRKMTTDRVRALADGRVHIGANAVALGLVDEIASFDDAMQATFTRIMTMKSEDFSAFATANPEDSAVKSLLAKGHSAGRASGRAEAIADLGIMLASFPGREAFAAQQFAAGKDEIGAKGALADVLIAENSALQKKIADGPQPKDNPSLALPGTSVVAAARVSDTPEAAIAAWNSAVEEELKKSPGDRMAAMGRVVQSKPNLHNDYLAAVNQNRNPRG